MVFANATRKGPEVPQGRVPAVDAVRGLAMALMALDHCRDFFTAGAAQNDPTNPATTDTLRFLTRWVTHPCAPTFVFLAGVAVFLSLERGRAPAEKAWLLAQRGVLLIVLELTLVRWAWLFDFSHQAYLLQVIWMLGVSMLVMAGLLLLPDWVKLAFGLALVLGHNAFDTLTPEGFSQTFGQDFGHWGAFDRLWRLLHAGGRVPLGTGEQGRSLYVLYPLVPWVGVMPLGYLAGKLYRLDPRRRVRLLLALAGICLAAFFALRLANGYGDPVPWRVFGQGARTAFSFLDVTKYPPSLEYLLVTLGLMFLALARFEHPKGRIGNWLGMLGQAPLFFYVTHLYLLHALAVGYALWRFGQANWLVDWGERPVPPDAGASLAIVYAMWLGTLAALTPLCRTVAARRAAGRSRWASLL